MKPARKKQSRLWTMPSWMLPYRDDLEAGCGGLSVEELYNDRTPYQINAPLALCAVMLKAKVALLARLRGELRIRRVEVKP